MAINSPSATTTGWIIFVAAIGMMFGLMSVDILTLKDWNALATPTFVGTFFGHISAVIAAFVGGRLIPTERTSYLERAGDPPPSPKAGQ
jgi:hypothetical protein